MDVYSLKIHHCGRTNPQAAEITQLFATFSSGILPFVCFPRLYFAHSLLFSLFSHLFLTQHFLAHMLCMFLYHVYNCNSSASESEQLSALETLICPVHYGEDLRFYKQHEYPATECVQFSFTCQLGFMLTFCKLDFHCSEVSRKHNVALEAELWTCRLSAIFLGSLR